MRSILSTLAVLSIVSIVGGCYPKGWNRLDPTLYQAEEQLFTTGPYLVRMAPRRVAVVIKHPLPKPPIVDWWVAEETQTSSVVLELNPRLRGTTSTQSSVPPERHSIVAHLEDGLWVAVLDRLPHDRRLEYRVRSSIGEVGPYSFHAGRSRNQPFRFAVFGDTRTGHQVHRLLIEAMVRERIDFVINSGDLVEFGGSEEQWDNYFRIEAPLISSAHLFPVVGNHDDSPRQLFQRFFLTPLWAGGRRYYVQDWGDVRVVVLDSEIELRAGSLQHAFAEEALKTGAQRGQLLLLAMHYPPYSSGEHGSFLEIRAVVSDLARRFGVELVVAGHDHDYERTKIIEGTTYVVAASAGATIRRLTPSDFTEVLRTEPHFLLIDVERGGLVARAINLAGDTFDSFTIVPNPPRELLVQE